MGRPKLFGKTVIGIDESNNGFQRKGLPMIIAAHVILDYQRAIPNNEAFERKVLAYSATEHGKFVERARQFLARNSLFCYTTLTPYQVEIFGLFGRAKAMASLVARAMELYDLQDHDLAVVCHRIDQSHTTRIVSEYLAKFLEEAEIKTTLEFRGDEQRNRAIRKADRVAYYLGGLKFATSSKHWPYREKKTTMDFVSDYISKHVIGEEEIPDRFEKHYK